MEKTQLSFDKSERLCGELRINKLFEQGKSFFVFPLRVCWLFLPQQGESPVQVMVGVPKKKIRKAVHRNRVRRLIRESYRLSKANLLEDVQNKNGQLQVAFIWMSELIPDFTELEPKMHEAVQRLRIKVKA